MFFTCHLNSSAFSLKCTVNQKLITVNLYIYLNSKFWYQIMCTSINFIKTLTFKD